jgi:hypothetical protein
LPAFTIDGIRKSRKDFSRIINFQFIPDIHRVVPVVEEDQRNEREEIAMEKNSMVRRDTFDGL